MKELNGKDIGRAKNKNKSTEKYITKTPYQKV
jgi:hypothetical protein